MDIYEDLLKNAGSLTNEVEPNGVDAFLASDKSELDAARREILDAVKKAKDKAIIVGIFKDLGYPDIEKTLERPFLISRLIFTINSQEIRQFQNEFLEKGILKQPVTVLAGRTKISTLGDLSEFFRVSSDTLVHKAEKDLWKISENKKGEVVIERLFNPDTKKPLKV